MVLPASSVSTPLLRKILHGSSNPFHCDGCSKEIGEGERSFLIRQCQRCAHPLYNVLAGAPFLLGQEEAKVNRGILRKARMQRGGRREFSLPRWPTVYKRWYGSYSFGWSSGWLMECERRTLCSGCVLRRVDETTSNSVELSGAASVRVHTNEPGGFGGVCVNRGEADHKQNSLTAKNPAGSVSCGDVTSSVCLFCGQTPSREFPALYPLVSAHKAISYVHRKTGGPGPINWECICKVFYVLEESDPRASALGPCVGLDHFQGDHSLLPQDS